MAKKNTKKKSENKLETVDDFVNVIKENKPSEILSNDNTCDNKTVVNEEKTENFNEVNNENNEVLEIVKETNTLIEKSKDEPNIKPKSFKDVFGYNMMGMIYD